jgi:hypothetical protein
MKEPESVFKGRFLKTILRRDESDSASEAELSGRWTIVERKEARTFELFREWEVESTDKPFATFRSLDHALLFAAIAPASSRAAVYEGSDEEEGWAIFCEGREVGELRWRDDEILDVLNVAGYLVRNPPALAFLLEAAGPSAIEAAGRLLYQRTMKKQRAGKSEPE